MSEPIRVAHIIGKVRNGGVESVVMNYYRHIDRTKIQFDFLIDSDFSDDVFRTSPLKEAEELGGRVYIIPPYQDLPRYLSELIKVFRREQYQIAHSHLNTLSVFPLYAAKKAGVPIRIAHSHSTAVKGEHVKSMIKYSLRPFAKVFATNYAACSTYAGEWLFGKKALERGEVKIFTNAIDLKQFRYDEKVREETRNELGVQDRFVIGNVGRFCYQKNQRFSLDVFSEVCKRNPKAVLLFIGDGKDRKIIEEESRKIQKGQVVFLGSRDDVGRLYPAMDVFLFPTRYEGLGLAAVEAQMCGVKTVVSQAVPSEARISPSTIVMDLCAGASAWADAVTSPCVVEAVPQEIREEYDISFQAEEMVDYYERLLAARQCEMTTQKTQKTIRGGGTTPN